MVEFTPEKSKQIALARLDLIHQWQEFRKKSLNKLQADYDFVKLYNTSNSHLFEILGKISRGSLHRWNAMLNESEDYTKLLPQYKYASVNEYRTVLTDEEIKIFMGLLLHPNRISIGKATALTKYKLKEQGQSFIPADITFRRYAKWFKDNNYDKWILARDGEKALEDNLLIDEIARQLDISRRTLFYWKNKFKWDEKKQKNEQLKTVFNSNLKEFVQTLMKKIMSDIDKNSKLPQSELYSLINLLKFLPEFQQQEIFKQTSSTLPAKSQQPKTLSPEVIAQIKRDFLGIKD